MVGEDWAGMQALVRAHRTRAGKLSAEVGGVWGSGDKVDEEGNRIYGSVWMDGPGL